MDKSELLNKAAFKVDDMFTSRIGQWNIAQPFNHIIIDDFLDPVIARAVANEFPVPESSIWKVYNNELENKKLINDWDKFGPITYQLFHYLNSPFFVKRLEVLIGDELTPDYGLNGGGLHCHNRGGKLNVHLDYSLHPRLQLERRLNLLVYLTEGWIDDWGGHLGLWRSNDEGTAPEALSKSIAPIFNRAVVFDTTQRSWHGLPEPISCPDSVTRKSIAVYYLCKPRARVDVRGKALFAPYKDQIDDPDVIALIKRRADVTQSRGAYGDR